MIHHRNWSEWFRMKWVASVTIHYSSTNIEVIKKDVGRFYIFAIFRLYRLESQLKETHPNTDVSGCLEWTV
jgi:hypothetical protein